MHHVPEPVPSPEPAASDPTARLDSVLATLTPWPEDGSRPDGPVAVDATDRLLLDEAAPLLATASPGEVVTIDAVLSSGAGASFETALALEPAGPELGVVAETRCLGSKVYVTVKATNESNSPVSIVVHTPYGEKTFTAVEPGKNAVAAFSSRAGAVPAGEATVTATRLSDGAGTTRTTAYDARSCS